MSSSRALAAAASVLFTFAPLAAAGTLTVGPAGSGAQFTEIQAAIDAALDDDVILVKPGTYAAIVVEKPLRILGDGTGTVRIAGSTESAVTIRGIAAPDELVLSGVEAASNRTVILVSDCPGTVIFQDLTIHSAFTTGVQLENCGRALVLDSRIQAGSAQLGIGAVFARISEVWIANSDITGVAIPVIFGHYIETTSALDLARSRLRLWRSRLRGGDGAPALKASNDGGAGIRASHSLVELFGGPSTIVAGGAGAGPQAGGPSHGGPGMDLRESSHVRAQAGVLVQGGSEPGGPSAPAIRNDGTSSFTLDPKIFPTLVSSAQQVTLGSTFALTLTGNPGGYQVLFASLRTGPTTIYRRVVGFGLLDRPNMMRIATEVLPPSAAFTLTLRVPSMPALIGATFFLQAAEQVGNAYAIGNPALVTITG